MAGLNDKNRQEKIKAIEEMIQIVLLRIPKEIEAMHFYTKAAEKSTSDEAKNLFLSLLYSPFIQVLSLLVACQFKVAFRECSGVSANGSPLFLPLFCSLSMYV